MESNIDHFDTVTLPAKDISHLTKPMYKSEKALEVQKALADKMMQKQIICVQSARDC